MSNHSLTTRGTDLPFSHKSVMSTAHEQNIICSKTLICRQLFAGHVVGSQPMKRKDKIHRMIIIFIVGIVLFVLGKVTQILVFHSNNNNIGSYLPIRISALVQVKVQSHPTVKVASWMSPDVVEPPVSVHLCTAVRSFGMTSVTILN